MTDAEKRTSGPHIRLLDVKGAADFLGVSVRWLREALARAPEDRGSVPHFTLPTHGSRRYVRFLPSALRAWLVRFQRSTYLRRFEPIAGELKVRAGKSRS